MLFFQQEGEGAPWSLCPAGFVSALQLRPVTPPPPLSRVNGFSPFWDPRSLPSPSPPAPLPMLTKLTSGDCFMHSKYLLGIQWQPYMVRHQWLTVAAGTQSGFCSQAAQRPRLLKGRGHRGGSAGFPSSDLQSSWNAFRRLPPPLSAWPEPPIP